LKGEKEKEVEKLEKRRMALVDYASDEDDDGNEHVRMEEDGAPTLRSEGPAPATSFSTQLTISPSSDSRGPASTLRPPSIRLPDAADLLGGSMHAGSSNSSGMGDASTVSSIMATSRKRPQLNGSAHALHHTKIPRGNSAPSRTRSENTGGALVPPQLRGRSNVATEDLDKLFVNRQQRRSD